ncbi:probable protein phosphatase 2C 33 [Typha angustifolia]|uniref:probable protein phosphatase 2C 33 n=1 Tax=Typha angustifolia TaxID=59011 RepID=UPI003C2B15F1
MGSCLSSSASDGRSDSSWSGPASPSSDAGRRHRKKGRRRSGLRSSEEELLKIPGRMAANGASSVASMFTQQGKKGTNQDAMLVWENFNSRTDTVFCGVFDGHGPYGHMVARKVRDTLPLKLRDNIRSDDCRENNMSYSGSMSEVTSFLDEEPSVSIESEEREKIPEIFKTLKESFLKAFKLMDKELRLHQSIDCFCSGTTAVTLVKQGQDLVIGNVGDSRAVLGTRNECGYFVADQLTVDLKPNLPMELERIKRCKGRVFALQDEPEVARMWLPNNDSPGLAMARAFGDFCLKDFGLISVPDVSYRRITERDEFIVLATDGVWDVLSNKEVVDIVAAVPTRSMAARTLIDSAVRAWRIKYPTSKIDDCAVVCLFLKPDADDTSNLKKNDIDGSLDASEAGNGHPSGPTTVDRPGTFQCSPEISPDVKQAPRRQLSRSQSRQRSNITVVEEEWSALEGVSRVNTLLTLPRLVPAGKQTASTKK